MESNVKFCTMFSMLSERKYFVLRFMECNTFMLLFLTNNQLKVLTNLIILLIILVYNLITLLFMKCNTFCCFC